MNYEWKIVMPSNDQVEHFVEEISKPTFPKMFNPWSQNCETETEPQAFIARKERLKAHLLCSETKLLIIGEAPGYQGCRYSGVAFTSERLLMEGQIPRLRYLKGNRLTDRRLPWSEPSATIVWKGLKEHELENETVLFNSVPWHPMGECAHSNRTPTSEEQKVGNYYLKMFLSLYENVTIAALGKVASNNLTTLGVAHTALRHPANGGATKFRNDLAYLAKSSVK
jgi:uracil-DNA glycosylase